jgi:hypothetical protein
VRVLPESGAPAPAGRLTLEFVGDSVRAGKHDPCAASLVAGDRVLVVDNLYGGEQLEEAERVRDPSHLRCYTEEEWRTLLKEAGLVVEDVRLFDKPIEFEPWLERAGCTGKEAARVRELAADRIADGRITLERIALKGRK